MALNLSQRYYSKGPGIIFGLFQNAFFFFLYCFWALHSWNNIYVKFGYMKKSLMLSNYGEIVVVVFNFCFELKLNHEY